MRLALLLALLTGVRPALVGSKDTREIAEAAVAYARRSVPDAIAALRAPDSVLRQIAEAKASEALST